MQFLDTIIFLAYKNVRYNEQKILLVSIFANSNSLTLLLNYLNFELLIQKN